MGRCRTQLCTYLSGHCLVVFLLCSTPSEATEFSGYLVLTSDYVKRGVTQSDEDPAIQLGIDVSFTTGVFAGIWGSTVDIDNGPSRRRDSEVNYYVGYALDVSTAWQLSANVVAYRYPGQVGITDYNYMEYSVGANFEDRLWLEYSYSPDLYHSGQSTRNVDFYNEWPLDHRWAIGGGGGYYDTSNLTGRAYWYWQLGATGSFRYLDVDIRFHGTDRWVPIVSAPNRADARAALTIRFPF